MPGGDLRAEKRAIDIHGKNLPPLRKRHINKCGFGHRPGIIDQHVNAPQTLDKMFNGLRALGQLAEVKMNGLCPHAKLRRFFAVSCAPRSSECQVIPISKPFCANNNAHVLPIPESDAVTIATLVIFLSG